MAFLSSLHIILMGMAMLSTYSAFLIKRAFLHQAREGDATCFPDHAASSGHMARVVHCTF